MTGLALLTTDGLPALVTEAVADAVPIVLAQAPTPDDPGGRGEDFGKSSPVGLLLLILFFIAVAFLVRSMNKHLKRVPASFDPPEPAKAKPDEPKADDQKPGESTAD